MAYYLGDGSGNINLNSISGVYPSTTTNYTYQVSSTYDSRHYTTQTAFYYGSSNSPIYCDKNSWRIMWSGGSFGYYVPETKASRNWGDLHLGLPNNMPSSSIALTGYFKYQQTSMSETNTYNFSAIILGTSSSNTPLKLSMSSWPYTATFCAYVTPGSETSSYTTEFTPSSKNANKRDFTWTLVECYIY